MAFAIQSAIELQPQLAQGLRMGAFVAFLAAATLFIGFNHKVFQLVLGEKSKTYWWLFSVMVVVPFLLVLYAFSYFFGDLFA
jgi:hypothetical protein